MNKVADIGKFRRYRHSMKNRTLRIPSLGSKAWKIKGGKSMEIVVSGNESMSDTESTRSVIAVGNEDEDEGSNDGDKASSGGGEGYGAEDHGSDDEEDGSSSKDQGSDDRNQTSIEGDGGADDENGASGDDKDDDNENHEDSFH
jgi:hypothetical protein